MKIDVIAITYGEPQNDSFGEQWRFSNRILAKLTRLVAPIPKIAVPFIGAWRGYSRSKIWRTENYSSPLESISRRQVECIQNALDARNDGNAWRVHLAFEFRNPSLCEILNRIRKLSCERLVLVPMYLATSDFTSGISERDFDTYQKKNKFPFPKARMVAMRVCHREISRVMAEFIRKQAQARDLTPERLRETGLLLGCHGTVIKPPRGVADTGYNDTRQVYDNLENELKSEFKAVAIGWLNHRLGGEWTTPTLETSAKTMREQGIREFVYFPFGFWTDNAETQLEGRVILRKLGITAYHHVPCVNDDPEFIRLLAERIAIEALK